MARRTKMLTIEAEGRDKGKVFVLTEMSASQAEDWALKVFLALARGGVEFPDDVSSAGLAGVASLGMKALQGLSFSEAKPLLDEMMECVAYMPDPRRANVTRGLIEDDIEEVATRIQLRIEVFNLHTSFLADDTPSRLN